MKILFTLLLISNFAFASGIKCEVKVNYDTIQTTNIDLSQNSKALIAQTDGMTFYLSKAHEIYSIELYNHEPATRMYASGLIDKNNGINFVSWSREAILEINCQM